ncbi:MAG: DivIVA domain-containing protein [Clostridia bacterium]|nr:DivIVA domain-containing protein [Clostridia bacterium]
MAETVFKKTFKGYDTNEVDEFIISLSDKYSQNENELTDKLRAAEVENERLKSEIAQLRALSDQNERDHAVELVEKQKEYDTLCAEIGEKMVLADKRAADIIKNAEKEAELILTNARRTGETEAKAIRMRAEGEATKLIEDTKRKCESVSAAADEFRARQNEMNQSIRETENRFADALTKLREGFTEQE